ncbi:hypothetical protein PHJA_000064700 [Phtheirospermum japonicum]|uniref:Ribosomal protein L34Ae n=1 Tax=Phtheirospermum japonicum TaxID=374723 RepID=A0A830B1B8_9LAMI|nr:hypothetical protein PHJA_000064700 [Phtheirospermum japonicum]
MPTNPTPATWPRDQPVPQPEEPKNNNGTHDVLGKSVNVDSTNNAEMEDDDDDFITNERLPPADEDEEEEEGETSSSEWRDVEAEGRQFWSGFRCCDSHVVSTPSPRSASKKLGSPFGCLSLRKFEAPEEETEHLQRLVNDPYQDIETAYVAQACLTWEALHCQYTQLTQKISCQPDSQTSYNHSAQQFQQFQVLLQRFIENEPFEMGSRPEIYARTRKSLPRLLQIPKIQASDEKSIRGEEASDNVVLATDLIRVIESSILSFRQFIKTDKKKQGGVRNIFATQNQMATPVQQIQSSLEKKAIKLKEVWKRSKSYKKKTWPSAGEDDVEMLLGLIDVKVLLRVLRMVRISKEQLFWCEEKMKKLGLSEGKLQRDPSPILFPC